MKTSQWLLSLLDENKSFGCYLCWMKTGHWLLSLLDENKPLAAVFAG
jgi:hypothetical protein